MNGTASIQNDIISVGKPLPRIKEATPLDGRKIHVVFDSGLEKIVDLEPALQSRRFYIPLRNDDDLFRSFYISEYGDAIEWNEDLDFSAMWIERLPDVSFTNSDFRQAMNILNMSLDGMAIALDISRRQVVNYRKDKSIPRHIALATKYLVEHHI